MSQEEFFETIPVGRLGVIALKSSKELGEKVDRYLTSWRDKRENEHTSTIAFSGYQADSFLIDSNCPRFGTGEGRLDVIFLQSGDELVEIRSLFDVLDPVPVSLGDEGAVVLYFLGAAVDVDDQRLVSAGDDLIDIQHP